MLRSLLFLPGNSPVMLQNGAVLPADALILDLEDAVAPDRKDAAAHLVASALSTLDYGERELVVRINAIDSPYWQNDLAKIVPYRPTAIMPPKCTGAETIAAVDSYVTELEKKCGLPVGEIALIPLIETALGIENAFAIAKSSPRIKAIFLGAEDLCADLQCRRTKEGAEIFYSRTRLVMAARAAGVEAIDTPFTDARDDEGIIDDAHLAAGLGFTGKAAISPSHLAAINAAFSPSEEDIEYALAVLDAIAEGKRQGKGAVSLRGKMVDKPIVARAEHTLDLARSTGRL